MENNKIKLPLTIINDLDSDLGKIQSNHNALLDSKYVNSSRHNKSIVNQVKHDFFVNLTDDSGEHFFTTQIRSDHNFITYKQMKTLGRMFTEVKRGYVSLNKEFKNNNKLNGIAESNVSMVDMMTDLLRPYFQGLGLK